jgi:hypothetical protein
MRGNGLGVGDCGAMSGWGWGKRHSTRDHDGRRAGWEHDGGMVNGSSNFL